VDISIFDNGFAPGTFIGSNADGVSSLRWDGILTQTPHVWRVNSLIGGQWVASGPGAFVACGSPFPLQVNPVCQDRNLHTADFRLATVIPQGTLQYIDLGWDPAFSPGSFYGLQVNPAAGFHSWPNIPSNITQYFRMNTMTPDGVWHSSPTASYVGGCIPSAIGSETPIGDRLIIPSAGVDAPINSSKVAPWDGIMVDPAGYFHANLYDFSSFAGLGGYANAGNMPIAAHVDCAGCHNGSPGTALFWAVRDMQYGDTAQYITAAGEVYNYYVVFVGDFSPDTDWAPFVASGVADMTLITCVGTFSGGHYDTRRLVHLRKY
jgi:hypothetical protein